MAILEALEEKDGFTDLEAQLADYIVQHADDVVRMKITDLAKASYTSNATIIRLCRKAGLDGYCSFRIGLASEIEKRRARTSQVDADHPFAEGSNVKTVVSSITRLTREAADISYAAIDAYEVERVARAIRSAGHVYLFGYGDSEVSCMAFANMLIKLGVRCTLGNLLGESSAVAHSVRKGDVVFVVSYRGRALDHLERVIPIMKEHKAVLVLVSAVAKPILFDYALRFPVRESVEGFDKIGTFYSQACIRFVLNCVYAELYELTYEQSSSHKLAIERTIFEE